MRAEQSIASLFCLFYFFVLIEQHFHALASLFCLDRKKGDMGTANGRRTVQDRKGNPNPRRKPHQLFCYIIKYPQLG